MDKVRKYFVYYPQHSQEIPGCCHIFPRTAEVKIGFYLNKTMARRQGHLGQISNVPSAHDHATIVRIVPDRFNHVFQLGRKQKSINNKV